jgi:hypothetical protein
MPENKHDSSPQNILKANAEDASLDSTDETIELKDHGTVIHNLDLFPRRKLIGRLWERDRLDQFLLPPIDIGVSSSIMIVFGPRGVGKSTLVRESAWCAVESGRFKSVLWFSREKFTDFLLGDHEQLPIPNDLISKGKKFGDPSKIIQLEEFEYIRHIHLKNPFHDEKERQDIYTFFRIFLELYAPFLIIVDDFDEKDNLNSIELCKELERVHHPNKIILTSRLLDHAFSDGVFETLEVNILDASEVKALVENDFQNTPLHQFPNQDLYQASELAWEWSAGLPIFITKCLVPKLQKDGWKFQKSKRWEQACNEFAEEYIQVDISSLDSDEKYFLIALATQEHLNNLDEKELALSLGFCPDDIEEMDIFYEILRKLQRNGLIGVRSERTQKDKSKGDAVWHKWTMFPFAKELVLNKLSSFQKDEFDNLQADHWSRILEYYKDTPQRIGPYIDKLLSVFLLCFENEDWNRAIKLGNLLSEIMNKLEYPVSSDAQKRFHYELLCKRLETGCRTCMDWWGIVQNLTKLSYFYLNAQEIGKATLVSEQAIELLKEAEENGKIRDEHWADISYAYAQIQAIKGNSDISITWFEKARQAYVLWGDLEGASKSGIALAQEYIKKDVYSAANTAAEQAKEDAIKVDAKLLAFEATLYMAEIANNQDKHETHMKLLQECITLADNEKSLFTFANNLRERLRTRRQEVTPKSANPVLNIVDVLMSPRVDWGDLESKPTIKKCPTHGFFDQTLIACPKCEKETSEACPVCRNLIEISQRDFATCKTCNTHFHLGCLSTIDNICIMCNKNTFSIGS